MITVNCFGIHSDEVGLRYLVQDNVANAYGFSQQESFNVETAFQAKRSPHNYKIVLDTKGSDDRTMQVMSPIPLKQKVFVAHKDDDLDMLSAFSGAHVIPIWMLNQYTLRQRLYVSNLQRLIVPNCNSNYSELITEITSGADSFCGVVVFQGDHYFSKKIERLDKLPEGLTVREAKRIGLANMSNYLRETDSRES